MARKKLRYIRFYMNPWLDIARKFDAETLGKLFAAAMEYAGSGTEPDFPRDSELQSMWLFCRGQIYRDMVYHGRGE